MDISSRFSLVDFLAYFFPGIFGALGLYLILLLPPFQITLDLLEMDIALAVLFFAFSYILGVVLSGFAEIFVRKKYKSRAFAKSIISLPGYEDEVNKSFNALFEISDEKKSEWSASKFYICRSLIMEFMPKTAEMIHRQSSLRQLRMSLLPVVIIWLIAGIGWGISNIINREVFSGLLLIVVSVLISITVILTLLERMANNEYREVREVLSAFLAGYRSGLFTGKGNLFSENK